MTKVQVIWYNGILVISGWKHHWAGPDRWHFVHTNSDFWLRKLICLFNSFFRTTKKKISRFVRTMDLLILSLEMRCNRSVCSTKESSIFNIYERDIFDIPSIHNVHCVNSTICSKAFLINIKEASLNCCEWTWIPWTNDPQHRTFIGCNSTVCSRACSG